MRFSRQFNPRIRFNTDGENGGSGGSTKPPVEEKFPKDTPWREMTPEQQVAYWQDKARKHEKNAKPADYDTLASDAQKWRDQQEQNQTPDERALKEARDAGIEEGRGSMLHSAIRAELRAHRPHMTIKQLDEFLEDVALSNFTKDGGLDTERVARLAENLAVDPDSGDNSDNGGNNGGEQLGDLLNRTNPPKNGAAGSIAEARRIERERYNNSTK